MHLTLQFKKSSLMVFAVVFIWQSLLFAQAPCGQPQWAGYFEPLTNGEGLRYPLSIGPLSWRLLGHQIQPVKGSDGRIHLAYALLVTNSWNRPATLKSIEVVDPTHGNAVTGKNAVVTSKEQDITGKLRLLSLPVTQDASNFLMEVPAGQSGIAYFDVTYADPAQVPRAIAHRVVVSVADRDGKPQDFTVLSPPMRLDCNPPVVLAPPFKGDGWVNANGCCREIGPHRFVMNSVNGSLAATEEFAIDWIRVDAQGHQFNGDPKDPKAWVDYGAELLAVAPGTVVEVMDDLRDVPAGKAPDNLTIPQIAGNRVIIDIGQGRFAEYDHLAPRSATVKVGDYVQQGQKIGLLGNTGNTTAPHLHFQLMDRPSTLDGAALPFVFAYMQLQGRITINLDELDAMWNNPSPVPMDTKLAKPLTFAMPLSLDALSFK
jgi:hypothetical protein